MAESLGDAVLHLRTDDSGLDAGINSAQGKSEALAANFENTGRRMQGVGKNLSLALTLPLAAFAAQAIPAAVESRQALAQVDASLKSMGPVAGRTSAQLQDMAGKLEDISLYDDDDILKSVTANMLTFGNISGDAFDRAQLAAVNLSAKLGTDLQSSTMMLGKALNDPVSGMTALTRAGVSFSEQQKDQIKAMVQAGDAAGAQKLFLGELEKQFGGAAEAQRKATPDAAAQQQWRKLQEVVGEIALKALPVLTGTLTSVLSGFNSLSPGTQTFLVGLLASAAAAGPLLYIVGGLVSGVGGLVTGFAKMGPVLNLLKVGFAIARVAALSALPALLPFLVPLAAIAAAIGVVYLAWQNWDKIKPIIDAVGSAISGWWTANVLPILNAVGKKIGEVIQWFSEMPGKIGTAVAAVYNAVKSWVGDKLATVWAYVEVGAQKFTSFFAALPAKIGGYVRDLYNGVKTWLQDKLGAVFEWVRSKIGAVADKFKWLWDVVVGHSYVPDLVDGISDEFGRLQSEMVDPAIAAADAVSEAFAGIEGPDTAGWKVNIDGSAMGVPPQGTGEPSGDVGDPPPESEAKWKESFRGAFKDGVKAAIDGDLGGFLKSKLQGIADGMFDKALDTLGSFLANQLEGFLSGILNGAGGGGGGGGAAGGLGAIISSLFAGGFSTGGTIPTGQWGIVGEKGPEPAFASAKGVMVRPSNTLGRFASSLQPAAPSINMPITIDATGADAAALGRVRDSIDRLAAAVPGMAIGAVQDAGERGFMSNGTWR